MRLALSLGMLSGVNIVATMLIQWYVLVTLGPGSETDALFAGMTVPQLVLAIVSGSLMHILVPLLAGEEEDTLRRTSWGFLLLVGGAFCLFSVVLYLSSSWWVPLTVPGFSTAEKALTLKLTRIQLSGMVFTALYGVLSAVYHARQQFIWAETTPVLSSMVTLGLLVWALPRFGVVVVAWANVLRSGFQTMLLVPRLGRYRRPDWRDAVFREAWDRIKPLLLGTTYYKADPLVDRFLASMAPAGGLSLLQLGQQLYKSANQIINKAIAAPMVPILARHAKTRDWAAFRYVYRKRLLWVCGLTGAGYVVMLLVGQTLLQLVIGHGAVTEQNVLQLWQIIVALVGMFMGGAMGQVLSTSFYAMGDTTTPTRIGVIGFTVGIVLKVVGFLQLGLLGIAVGTTLYYSLNVLALWVLLESALRHVSSGQS